MEILIITQYFWPETFRINDLAIGLKERGHNVTVLTGLPNYPEGHLYQGYKCFNKLFDQFQGIKIIRAPIIPRGKGNALRLILNYLSFAMTASLFGPLLCRNKFDLIFVFEISPITVGLPALVMKRLRSRPIIFWVQDLWPESLLATGAVKSKIILDLTAALVRFIYLGCDQILAQSQAFFTSIRKYGGDPRKILYFPNSAETLYRPVIVESDAPERLHIPPGFGVMFAGNIGAAQDFGTIIEAADRLKDLKEIHWIIIGDGRMRAWVAEQVQMRGLSDTVHLLGRFPMEKMPQYFALADALLVTLKKEPIFALTIPSKIQSYLACAKPIIAALDGEGARIVNEAGAGLSCPAEKPELLAEAVLAMSRLSAAERAAMGKRARNYFERNFERTLLLDRLEGWIKELGREAG